MSTFKMLREALISVQGISLLDPGWLLKYLNKENLMKEEDGIAR